MSTDDDKPDWRPRLVTMVGGALSLLGAVGASAILVADLPREEARDKERSAEVVDLRRAVESLSGRVEAVESRRPTTGTVPELAELSQSIEQVDERLSAIEESIVESPGRALELPLLRADLEDLSERMREDREDAESAVDDVRTLVYGSVAAIVLSLLGLLASTSVKRRFDQA